MEFSQNLVIVGDLNEDLLNDNSPADKWHIFLEPGSKVQTFFLDGFM